MDGFSFILLSILYIFSCIMWLSLTLFVAKNKDEDLKIRKSFLFYSKFFFLGPLCWVFFIVSCLVEWLQKLIMNFSIVSSDIKSEIEEEYSLRESIKKQFECGCMTDELLDSLMSKGSSVGDFECKHGLSIQFARGGMISHDG